MADFTVRPGHLNGSAHVPPSKSILHRELIAIALTTLNTGAHYLDVLPYDIEETASRAGDDVIATLHSLGAITGEQKTAYCNESGTTLRLFLPVLAALGREVDIHVAPGLAVRPINDLTDELSKHGCTITTEQIDASENRFPGENVGAIIRLRGKLAPGNYTIPGNISSQYISGLLMALPLINGTCSLTVNGKIGSRPYVDMTLKILKNCGLTFVEREDGDDDSDKLNQNIIFEVHGDRIYALDTCSLEPDWSAAAFWKVAEYIDPKSHIEIPNLQDDSCQGDSKVMEFLGRMRDYNTSGQTASKDCVIDLDNTPDLLPALAVAASAGRGRYLFTGIERLKYKESDRIAAVSDMINSLGGRAETVSAFTGDTSLLVHGVGKMRANTVNSRLDHRIAMASAIAVLISDEQMTVVDGQSVSKSYPGFWDDFNMLQQNN